MANMARKIALSEYQIGIYTLTKIGSRWEATSRDERFSQWYKTLAAAHLALTGEPMREKRR